MACLVRMQDDMLLLLNWNNNYSVHKHDFESPWLWDLNRENSYISFHWLHLKELAQSLSGRILFGIGGKVL